MTEREPYHPALQKAIRILHGGDWEGAISELIDVLDEHLKGRIPKIPNVQPNEEGKPE